MIIVQTFWLHGVSISDFLKSEKINKYFHFIKVTDEGSTEPKHLNYYRYYGSLNIYFSVTIYFTYVVKIYLYEIAKTG